MSNANVEKVKSYFKLNPSAITEIVAYIASITSTIISISNVEKPSWRLILVVCIAIAGWFFLFIREIVKIFKAKVYDKKKEKDEIDSYMKKLYENATGSIFISTTGGMNWATPEIMKVLSEKAASSRVVIFVPSQNTKTMKLMHDGAKIIDKSKIGFAPSLNYSIINPDSRDSIIAIGRSQKNDFHCISEYGSSSDVIVVASELARFMDNIK